MYHVDLPREFLEARRLFLPVDNQHVAFVGSPQMLNAVLLASGSESGPAAIQWMWLLAIWLLVVTTASRWAGPIAGGIAGSLLWAYPVLPLLGILDLVDVAMGAAVLVTSLVAVHWVETKAGPNAVFLGLMAGCAVSVKYQSALYLVGVVVLVVGAAALRQVRLNLSHLSLAGVVALLVWAPVAIKNTVLFGDPVFPMLSGPYVPSWVYELEPSYKPSFGVTGVLAAARQKFDIWTWIVNPSVLTPEAIGSWFGLPPPFILGLLAFLSRWRSRILMLVTPVMVGTILLILIQQRTNLRYLLPVAPVAVLAVGLVVSSLLGLPRANLTYPLVVLVVLFSAFAAWSWVGGVLAPSSRSAVALGIITENEWANRPGNRAEQEAIALGDTLRSLHVSSEAPALLLYEGRGDLIDAPVLQDNVFRNWEMLSDVVAEECPENPSWGWVVRSGSTVDYLSGRGVDPEYLRLNRFDDFAGRCLDEVASVGGYEIFSLAR
jgi:hypothetical protein